MALDESPESGPPLAKKVTKDLPPIRTDLDEAQPRPRRKSLRIRPPVPDDHHDEKPLPPVKDSPSEPCLQPRKSNMSLFSLFSKPRFQKQRGYAEAGLTPTLPHKDGNGSRMDLDTPQQTPTEIPRSGSALSFRTHTTTATHHRSRFQELSSRPQPERGPAVWEPPPLFQAFPQSSKHGLAEISTLAPETVLAKSRAGRGRGLQVLVDGDARPSSETNESRDAKRAPRTALKHGGIGSLATTELQRKIFVLITSGYLLQYAEYGPSGRLPEKVLPLDKDSAAFASDLIAGRHHVLQISQAVDAQGLPVAPSRSLRSRMGMRNNVAQRTISNILLVLPDGDEMDSWLSAVRKQIGMRGGPHTRVDSSAEVNGRSVESRQETREQERSHSPMPPPKDDGPPKEEQNRTKSSEEAEAFGERLAAGASYVRPNASEDEAFAEKLAAGASYNRPKTARARSPSDSPSVASSFAQSLDHQRLNSLRNSVRMSHQSNGTAVTSRTNSMTSEPASAKPSMEAQVDGGRGPYRNLASYGSSSNKRRSAMPMPSSLQAQPEASPDLSIDTNVQPPPSLHFPNEDSPVVGRASPLPNTSPPSYGSRTPTLQTKTSLPSLSEQNPHHDSRMSIVPSAAIAEASERPQSIVGDLPAPASRSASAKSSPPKRTSYTLQPHPTSAPADRQMHRMSSAPALRSQNPNLGLQRPILNRRVSSQQFSLPLRINPSPPANPPPPPPGQQHPTQPHQPQQRRTSSPLSHTNSSATPNPTDPPKPSRDSPSPSRPRPQKRLSLFPSAAPAAPQPLTQHPTRSPSTPLPHTPHTPANSSINAHDRLSLKRPISIQIRANQTPFLSSLPPHPNHPSPSNNSSAPAAAAPIRQLRPSRSSLAIAPPHPKLANLPASRGPFSASATGPKGGMGLPALDLGLPVVGLGPPAPPPSAPLPKPPSMGGVRGRASPSPMAGGAGDRDSGVLGRRGALSPDIKVG